MADKDVVIVVRASDQASDPMKNISSVFRSAGKDIEQSFGGSLQTVTGYWKNFLGAAGVSTSLKSILDIATNWENTVFKMKTTFGLGADEMIGKAKELSSKTGSYFSTGEISKAMAQAADQMDRVGLGGDQYFTIVARATEVAAAKGMDLVETMDKIVAAMDGSKKASRALGAALSDEYMKNIAYGGSLKDVWDTLSAGEKYQYRYQTWLQQTDKFSDVAAEKTKTLEGAFKALGNQLRSNMNLHRYSSLDPYGLSTPGPEQRGKSQKELEGEAKTSYAMILERIGSIAGQTDALYKLEAEWLNRQVFSENEANQLLDKRQSQLKIIAKLKQEEATWAAKVAEIESRPDEEKTYMQTRRLTGLQGGPYEEVPWTTMEPADKSDLPEAQGKWAKVKREIEAANEALKRLSIEQQKFDQQKITRLTEEIAKNSWSQSGIESPVFQKDLSQVLDFRTKEERKINELLEQRFDIERKIETMDAGDPQRWGLQDRIQEINEEIGNMRGTVQNINGFLDQLHTQVQLIGSETGDRLRAEAERYKSVLNEIRNYGLQLDTTEAESALERINQKLLLLRSNLSQGSQLQIDILGAMSPALPFTQTYDKLLGMIGSIPEGMDYTIRMAGENGMSLSGALESTQSYLKYSRLQAKYDELQTALSSQLPAFSTYSGYSRTDYSPQLRQAMEVLLPSLQDAQLEFAQSYAKNIESGQTGGSGSGSGINVSFGNTIINYTSPFGNAKDDVITMANRIDEELAQKIRSSNSKMISAIRAKL